jgi:hypothetical protein
MQKTLFFAVANPQNSLTSGAANRRFACFDLQTPKIL